MNLNISFCLRSPNKSELVFNPTAPFRLFFSPPSTLRGFKLIYQLRDDTGVRFKLTGKDAQGNVAEILDDIPEITVSDPEILTAIFENNFLVVQPVGPLGASQVVVLLDLPDGSKLNGTLDVTVVAGSAVSFSFEAAETFPVTASAP